jgi:hypothetical protein
MVSTGKEERMRERALEEADANKEGAQGWAAIQTLTKGCLNL